MTSTSVISAPKKQSLWARLVRNYKKHKSLYWIACPVVLYYLVFKYIPMFGVVIAFQDYRPGKGFLGSNFVGFKHFIDFLTTPTASRTIINTLRISVCSLLIEFPAPIILALLLNEIRVGPFKKVVQTLSYMPHFISTVVVCGIIMDFTLSTGVINDIAAMLGFERQAMLGNVNLWVPIYIISNLWQGIGWGSILYLATLSGTDPNLYEAAVIDGAGRWKQMLHVTLPTLVPIIVLQLIMRIGSMMSVGYEKTILLYSPLIYEKADIISSFVYRRGLQEMSFSFGAAVGLFNSVINLILLVSANWFSRKISGESMW
ncbi:MAG: ABC transporter permease subunit [Oscillospiraceae bacterium]|nr:ABC transporter permease subunit [Oscillospiraceae bacterium]